MQPGAYMSVTYGGREEIKYKGDFKAINEFLSIKSDAFGSIESEWLPRVNYIHGNDSFTALIHANDSITDLHLKYLVKHANELPDWYARFESKRLQFLDAHWKLNSLMYRKRMLGKTDSVSDRFLAETISGLPVNDMSMLGNNRYMHFLGSFAQSKISDTDSLRFDCYIGTQLEMNLCSSKEFHYYDSLLNTTYQSLIRKIDLEIKEALDFDDDSEMNLLKDSKQVIINSQRHWIKQRDYNEKIWAEIYKGGSMMPLVVNVQATRDTRQRIDFLKQLLDHYRLH